MTLLLSLDFKFLCSIAGMVTGIAGSLFYFRDIYRGTTKPHAFSWFIWGVGGMIIFFVQLYEKGGFGSWVVGVNALLCLTNAGIGLYQKQINYTRSDWIILVVVLVSLIPWYLIKNPLFSVLIITTVLSLGYIPTLRKIYLHPESETILTWYAGSLRGLFGIFALNVYVFNSLFFPIVAFILNVTCAILILARRTFLK